MKKISLVVLVAAAILAPSCKNQKAVNTAGERTPSQSEEYAIKEFKLNLENLLTSAKEMRPAPFATASEDGRISLTEKEKMVKPEFLIDPSLESKAVTLQQKYRLIAMLEVDKVIAGLYDMPVEDIDAALSKLIAAIDDPAMEEFVKGYPEETEDEESTQIADFFDAEYDQGRANFFWEAVAAMLVEQVYIMTRNVDKFLPMFDDRSASEVTYNFVCLHESIVQLIKYYPEMKELNEVLKPLYVINAINVEQLRDQLLELKGSIETVRAILLS